MSTVEVAPAPLATPVKPLPLAVANVNYESHVEEKTVETPDGVESFPFVTVDNAEKWRPAADHNFTATIGINGTEKRFKLRGLSYAFWEAMERSNPLPEQEVDALGNPVESTAYRKKLDDAISIRQITVIEKATGIAFPGNNIHEKLSNFRTLPPAETKQLYDSVVGNAGAFTEGRLLGQYELASSRAIKGQGIKDIDSFDLWTAASQTNAMFRLQRGSQPFILEFLLKSISSDTKQNIEELCKLPEPPKSHKRDPVTKRLLANVTEPNYKDTSWLEKCRVIEQKEMVLVLESVLLFTIPGNNAQEKYTWISERLIGEVVALKNFIDNEIYGYRTKIAFS